MAVVLAANCRVQAETLTAASAELQITIYDKALLPREVLVNALDGLRLILQQAKIRSRTVLGNLDDSEASLFMYVAPPPDGRKGATVCGARRDIALEIIAASPWSLQESVLGMSSPFADFGLSVRIFDDHIREAAARHGRPHATVLAYAMAHEIGHVLLRSDAHTRWGIMSGIWTEYEYTQIADGVLLFSAEAAKTMKANLRTPICQPSIAAPHRHPSSVDRTRAWAPAWLAELREMRGRVFYDQGRRPSLLKTKGNVEDSHQPRAAPGDRVAEQRSTRTFPEKKDTKLCDPPSLWN